MRHYEMIEILADLAESEKLFVESPEKDVAARPRWSVRLVGGAPPPETLPESFLRRTVRIAAAAWNYLSEVWNYFSSNYVVRARVELLPANYVIRRLYTLESERLSARMREILNKHSIVDLNTLANEIQKDFSLVRKIVLKHLIEYLVEEMSLPVRVGNDDALPEASES